MVSMLSLYMHLFELLVILLLSWFLLSKRGRQVFRRLKKTLRGEVEKAKARRDRTWHPKSEADCPHCQSGVKLKVVHLNREVEAWSERKGVGGRRKAFCTGGFACLNETCAYFGVRSEKIHALVKDTDRGKDRDIVQLRCQCCQKRFSSRKGTPLYYLKKKSERVEQVLWLSAEGVDVSVLVRFRGYDEATIMKWVSRAGEHSRGLHEWLTTYSDDEWVFDAIRSGADGFLLKDLPHADLFRAIRDTMQGKTHVDPSVAGKLFDQIAKRATARIRNSQKS